jgi:NAD(P)-dependent dehydrogenase (short-subunit alcohol dehydrogenase family)
VTLDAIAGAGGEGDWHRADLADAAACRELVAATIVRFGALDVLVNNAAANPYFGSMLEVDLARWQKTVDVNLRGTLVFVQAAWREWMREHGGTVINVVSTGGLQGEPELGVYNTTKAGAIHMTRLLACELGPGVRVNALAPGLVKTDFSRALWEGKEESEAARLPLGRLGTPLDLAQAALFLASDLASWITGLVLVVDGGALVARRRHRVP